MGRFFPPPGRGLDERMAHAPKIDTKDKPTVAALREIAEGKTGIEMLKKVPI